MRNIQLLQRYLSNELFEKVHKTPLGHLVSFAELDVALNQNQKDEIVHAINMIAEYRAKEADIPSDQLK